MFANILYNSYPTRQVCQQYVGQGDGGHDQHQEEGGRGGCPHPGEQQHSTFAIKSIWICQGQPAVP